MTALALSLFGAPVLFSQTASTPKPAAKPAAAPCRRPAPEAFPTAQAAATALIQAASSFDEPALAAMFGPDGKDLVSTGDPVRDKSYALAFASLAQERHTVVVSPANPGRATLQVGREHWPLPVPLVKIAGKWYFDARAGRDEILFRRVGANELDAIEVCRGFVEAQHEYALALHDDSTRAPVRAAHHQHARQAGRPVLEERRRHRRRPDQRSRGQGDRRGLRGGHGIRVSRLLLSGPEGPGPRRAARASSTT